MEGGVTEVARLWDQMRTARARGDYALASSLEAMVRSMTAAEYRQRQYGRR